MNGRSSVLGRGRGDASAEYGEDIRQELDIRLFWLWRWLGYARVSGDPGACAVMSGSGRRSMGSEESWATGRTAHARHMAYGRTPHTAVTGNTSQKRWEAASGAGREALCLSDSSLVNNEQNSDSAYVTIHHSPQYVSQCGQPIWPWNRDQGRH